MTRQKWCIVQHISFLQNQIERLDFARRTAHEAAIDASNQLNRICARYSLEPFFKGDAEDRYQVADFAEDVTIKLFEKGQHKSIEELVEKRETVKTNKTLDELIHEKEKETEMEIVEKATMNKNAER